MDGKITYQSIDSFYNDFNVYSSMVNDEVAAESNYSDYINSDFFIIFLFERARGTHMIDGKKFPLKDFQMNLVFPGQRHQYQFREQNFVHKIVVPKQVLNMFSTYLLFPLAMYKTNPCFQLEPAIFYRLLYELKATNRELKENNSIWEMVFPRFRVIQLIISKEAARRYSINRENSATKKLTDFFKLVIMHFRTERNVKFYADKLSVTPNYLNIISRRFCNKTASAIINNEVLLEIQMLLVNSKRPIKEIAFALDFNDLPSFSSFFSKNAGISPREFAVKYTRPFD